MKRASYKTAWQAPTIDVSAGSLRRCRVSALSLSTRAETEPKSDQRQQRQHQVCTTTRRKSTYRYVAGCTGLDVIRRGAERVAALVAGHARRRVHICR